MKLREVIEKTSLKAAAREAGLELRMVGGRVELTPTDPDDPRYCTDFIRKPPYERNPDFMGSSVHMFF